MAIGWIRYINFSDTLSTQLQFSQKLALLVMVVVHYVGGKKTNNILTMYV